MTVCSECGNQVDPDVAHVQHESGCNRVRDDQNDWLCDCPEVCAACCRVPGCPLRDNQETPT